MALSSDQIIFGAGDGQDRIDGTTARRILDRAAVAQHRLDKSLDETYSLAELEDIAQEAGISRKALHVAINDRPGWLDPLLRRLPRRWSGATKYLVLMTATGVVLLGLMLAFPIVAKVLFWATVIVLVMVLLGVSPF